MAKKNTKRGFTLVELIVVLVILAVLAALLIPALTGYSESFTIALYRSTRLDSFCSCGITEFPFFAAAVNVCVPAFD